jgi:methionine-rich copper-binding protein CopC
MRRSAIVLAAILAGNPAAALAHAFLDHAVPPVGATIAAAPTEVRLYFSEPIEPLFSGIELATAEGQTIGTPHSAVAPGDSTQLILPLPPLPPGKYRVRWHVVSVDAHRTEGAFTFEVNP